MKHSQIILVLISSLYISSPLLATTFTKNNTTIQPSTFSGEGERKDYFMEEPFLAKLNQEVDKLHGDPSAVFVFGGTGAGKSTSINAQLFHDLRYEKQKVESEPVQDEQKESSFLKEFGLDMLAHNDSDDSLDEYSGDNKEEYVERIVLYKQKKGCEFAKMGYNQVAAETTRPHLYRHARPYLEEIFITGYLRAKFSNGLDMPKIMDLTRVDEGIILSIRAYAGRFISGYYDTPGFNDTKDRLSTCLLNNILLHKTPRVKTILLVYNFSSLKLEKGSVFKMKLMDNIMKLFKPKEIYKDSGSSLELDSKKMKVLFKNIFILFTHVDDKSMTRKKVRAKYLYKFMKYYLSNRHVVENYNFGTILSLIFSMNNFFLMRPVGDLARHRRMHVQFALSPGIDRSKFAFIGSPKDREQVVTLTEYHIQKVLDHMNTLEGAKQEILNRLLEIKKIEQEIVTNTKNIENLANDTLSQKEALEALKKQNREELKEREQVLEKEKMNEKDLESVWKKKCALLDAQEPDRALWDDSLERVYTHREMKTEAVASGFKGAIVGGGAGGLLLGVAAVMVGATAAPVVGAGALLGGIIGIIAKVNEYKEDEKKGKTKPIKKTQFGYHTAEIGMPIVGYECIFQSSKDVVWKEVAFDKKNGKIEIGVDLNQCLHEQGYLLTIRIKRLKRYFVAHKARIKRMEREVKRSLAAYKKKQQAKEALLKEIEKLNILLESLSKNKKTDIEQTLILEQEKLKVKKQRLHQEKMSYQEEKKKILASFAFFKEEKTGLTLTEKICSTLPIECFFDKEIALKRSEYKRFFKKYSAFKATEQEMETFFEKL